MLLSLRWGSREGQTEGSVGIRWVQIIGLIPVRSWSSRKLSDVSQEWSLIAEFDPE